MAHVTEVYSFNVDEGCDEANCYACDSDENARSDIIIGCGCNAYIFFDRRKYINVHTKTGIPINCATAQLIAASDGCG